MIAVVHKKTLVRSVTVVGGALSLTHALSINTPPAAPTPMVPTGTKPKAPPKSQWAPAPQPLPESLEAKAAKSVSAAGSDSSSGSSGSSKDSAGAVAAAPGGGNKPATSSSGGVVMFGTGLIGSGVLLAATMWL